MTADDIPCHQSRNAGSPPNRLTLQHIQPSGLGPNLPQLAPHNPDARQPQDISQWPLPIIVDLSFAGAVLRAWGQKTFIEYVRENSRDFCYKSGVEGDNGEDATPHPATQAPHPSTARTEQYRRRCRNKGDMDVFDVLMALWTRAAREGERKLPGSDADNENKVQTWVRSIEESTS